MEYPPHDQLNPTQVSTSLPAGTLIPPPTQPQPTARHTQSVTAAALSPLNLLSPHTRPNNHIPRHCVPETRWTATPAGASSNSISVNHNAPHGTHTHGTTIPPSFTPRRTHR